jgi:hypothetical protein
MTDEETGETAEQETPAASTEDTAASEHPRGEAHAEAQERVQPIIDNAVAEATEVVQETEQEVAAASTDAEVTTAVTDAEQEITDIGRQAESAAEEVAQAVGEEFNLPDSEIDRVCERVMEKIQDAGIPTPIHENEQRSQIEDEIEAEVPIGEGETAGVAESDVQVDDTPDEAPEVAHPYYRKFKLFGRGK